MLDSRAIIGSNVKLGSNVRVGAYAIIKEGVEIGDNTSIGSHTVIHSNTIIGRNNRIHESATLGGDPQSINYQSEPTFLRIGDNNTIREYVTISRGTATGDATTHVGDRNFIMAYSHIAHDCQVNNDCVLTNSTSLAGFVEVGNCAFLGGFTLVHQHCRIGAYCMTGINSILRQDVPPFMTINGNPAKVISLNIRGLKRRNFSTETIDALKKVFRLYFRQNKQVDDILSVVDETTRTNPQVCQLLDFIRSTQRGVLR